MSGRICTEIVCARSAARPSHAAEELASETLSLAVRGRRVQRVLGGSWVVISGVISPSIW